MAEQMNEQQMQQQAMAQQSPPEQSAGPEDMRNAVASDPASSGDEQAQIQEIHERFVLNVMRMASDSQYDKMMSIMKSAKNPAQGLGRALLFIMQAVKKGLEAKDIEIPEPLWLAENGLVEQSARLLSMLGLKAGVELTPESIQAGEQLAAQAISEIDDEEKRLREPQEGPQEPPQRAEQPPQGGGLLSQAGGV